MRLSEVDQSGAEFLGDKNRRAITPITMVDLANITGGLEILNDHNYVF